MNKNEQKIKLGDLVRIRNLGGEWFSVEKIDVKKKKFQAGYNLLTLNWNGRWFSFNDVTAIYSAENQKKDRSGGVYFIFLP